MEFQNHAFSGYDVALNELLQMLDMMTKAADSMIVMVSDALQGKEVSFQEAKGLDKEVGKTERDVTNQLHSILSKYPASADELRFLLSTVKIAASLDKIGDLGKKTISHISASSADVPADTNACLLDMVRKAQTMLGNAADNITAYKSETVAEILSVDDEVNALYASILKNIEEHAEAQDLSPAAISTILLAAKYIERMADHAFEIARMTYFFNEGKRARKKKLRKQVEAE